MSNTKPLINLAILETLKAEKTKDEIDLFVPYVAISINNLKNIPFTAVDIQGQLKNDFGIDAPIAAVDVLLTRSKKRDLIRIENHVYFPVVENIKPWKVQYDGRVDSVDESINNVVNAFIGFTKNKYGKDIGKDEAIDYLYEYLVENIGDSALISIKKKNKANNSIKNRKHLTANFIADSYFKSAGLWECIEVVARSIMLGSYLGYANQIAGKKKYENITVYLDTPIVLGMLGYSGENKATTLTEMINMLVSYDVNVVVFDITFREVEGILLAWKSDLAERKYDRFNPKTLDLLKHKGIDQAALDTHISLLEKRIEDHGATVKRGFKLRDQYNCNVSALEQKIKDEFHGKWVDPRHDADALNRIVNTRKDERITKLSQEFSVFVTPNVALVNIGADFFGDLDRSIPYVVTDKWLTTMFWFKHPEIFKDLPTGCLSRVPTELCSLIMVSGISFQRGLSH